MNTVVTITTDISEWKSYSTDLRWYTYAIINGKRTSMNCMHNHKSKELAERCAIKYFTPTLMPLINAAITQVEETLHEISWTDEQGRLVTRRFHYLPKKETNQ